MLGWPEISLWRISRANSDTTPGSPSFRTLAEAGQNRVSTPCEVGVREEIKAAEPDECAVCSINRLPLNLISFVAPLHGEPLGFEALVDRRLIENAGSVSGSGLGPFWSKPH